MSDLLRDSWDETAEGYADYFVARFAPWAEEALAVLFEADLPPGPIAVPCCGPGSEILPLATDPRTAERHVIGIDLSPRMIVLANARCQNAPRPPRLIVGDCHRPSCARNTALGRVGFLLRASADAGSSLRHPFLGIRAGGRWRSQRHVLAARLRNPTARSAFVVQLLNDRVGPTESPDWETSLSAAIEQANLQLIADRRVAHGHPPHLGPHDVRCHGRVRSVESDRASTRPRAPARRGCRVCESHGAWPHRPTP